MSYSKEEIAQGMAETYFYNRQKCGQSNLSGDEVHARDKRRGYLTAKYICLKCLEKERVVGYAKNQAFNMPGKRRKR